MTTPTPDQLRAAADLLGQAATTTSGGVTGPTNLVLEAETALGHTLPARGLDAVGSWRTYYNDPEGWRWLVQAARLRLLVEAWALMRDDMANPHLLSADLIAGWLEEVQND